MSAKPKFWILNEPITPEDDEDIWCIVDPETQLSLCGQETEGGDVPDEEVPDEMTCKDCLAIKNAKL